MTDLNPQTQKALADLMLQVTDKKNPEMRKTVLKAVKEVDPNASFPELDRDDIESKVMNRLDAFEHTQKAKEYEAQQQQAKNRLIERGYNAEDLTKIEDIRKQHGIEDYEIASKVYAADVKPPAPVHDIRGVRPWKAASLEAFKSNPKDKARQVAYETLDELRNNRRAG